MLQEGIQDKMYCMLCDFTEHLFTLSLGPDGGLEHQVFEDGSKWSDTNSSSHQNRHLKVNPLLMALTKWAVQVQLGMK